MKKIFGRHKLFWLKREFLLSVVLGLVLVAASLFVSFYANAYTARHASNSVSDILLDNIPVINVSPVFSEGAVVFVAVIIIILVLEPKYLPFTLKSIALFLVVRSLFLILTHLGAPQSMIAIDPTDWISKLSSGDDLFFSGHTGLPFLMAFIFWNQKIARYFFLACTFVGGASVILGHLHYSIDVFSALFISFGIFHIAKNIFKKDFQLLA